GRRGRYRPFGLGAQKVRRRYDNRRSRLDEHAPARLIGLGSNSTRGEIMAVDIPKLFNEQLPGALAKNADEAKSINATYQMNVTGAGSWHLDLTSAGPTITQGEKPADCTITITSDDFQKLYE